MEFDKEAVKKQLDAVVGDEFRPPRRPRELLLKWVGGAILAVAAMAIVMGTLHHNMTEAESAPPPKKPVTVTIVPHG